MYNIVIIIPCYNEEKRLPVDDFNEYISENSQNSFVFVNDGSKDKTIDVLLQMSSVHKNVYVVDNKVNKGKASAIQDGIRYSLDNIEFKYIGFFDADLATPLFEIKNLEQEANKKDALMVVCSRIRRLGSVIDRAPSRYLLGRIFATFTSQILMLPVYDTQCGAKIMRKDFAEKISQESFKSKWFFDIEIFARSILHYGYRYTLSNVIEYPMLEWIEKGDSRLKFKDFLKTPLELFKLNRIYHKKIKSIKKSEINTPDR